MAAGIVPAVDVGHPVWAEAVQVFGAVDIGIDLGIHPLLLQEREVVEHLLAVVGSAAQQVLVV